MHKLLVEALVVLDLIVVKLDRALQPQAFSQRYRGQELGEEAVVRIACVPTWCGMCAVPQKDLPASWYACACAGQ